MTNCMDSFQSKHSAPRFLHISLWLISSICGKISQSIPLYPERFNMKGTCWRILRKIPRRMKTQSGSRKVSTLKPLCDYKHTHIISPSRSTRGSIHAMNAEKLMTLIAIPAYDPINIVKIILIISCAMDVCVIKACFCPRDSYHLN